jgi:anti-sigma B factor antagonist
MIFWFPVSAPQNRVRSNPVSIAAEPHFRAENVRSGALAVIALHGELDMSVTSRVAQAVDDALDADPLMVVIDLRGLTFMDSSGLSQLVKAGRRCQTRGRRFLLIRGAPQIERLMAITGFDGYFPRISDLDHLDEGLLGAGI